MAKVMYKPREPGTLKAAIAALIEACGGLTTAARVVRVGVTSLQRYSDPEEPACHMPADIIAALEALCGEPIVTEFLAHQAGYALFRPAAQDGPAALAVDFATLGQEVSALFGDYARALGDAASPGRVDAREAAPMVAETDRLLTTLMHLRGQLVARTGERH